MVKTLEAANKAARKAIESTYEGLCTIVEYQDVTNPETHFTGKEEVTVLENQPCRLSFETIKTVVQTEDAAAITQSTKLFISPEISIKGGSKIVVTQSGITTAYSCSGEPAVHNSHQEIMLELFTGWA